jgi:hypothetical protein
MTAGAAEYDGLGHRFGAPDTLRDILEFRILVGDIAECVFSLVELALTLEIERKVVDQIEHRVVRRKLLEIVERGIELPLPLVTKAQHAVALRQVHVGTRLAAFGDEETLGRQRQVPNQQQCD